LTIDRIICVWHSERMASNTFTTPEYLLSGKGCERDICYGGHADAAKQAPTGRWFITMGHPGFNSTANNRDGYASQAKAEAAIAKYGRR
jgi:hypothetical protein